MSQTITPAAIKKTLTLDATPQKAFEVFTAGFGSWWPKSHAIGDSPLKVGVIEPGVGGRWYGLHEDGAENLWGDVLVWDPPGHIVLAWRITGAWTYDPELLTEVDVRFIALGDGRTRMDFEHRGLERFGDGDAARATIASMDGGWGTLLGLFKTAADA
jgi:uncharacterized protein YndB with AHSA1/START domain